MRNKRTDCGVQKMWQIVPSSILIYYYRRYAQKLFILNWFNETVRRQKKCCVWSRWNDQRRFGKKSCGQNIDWVDRRRILNQWFSSVPEIGPGLGHIFFGQPDTNFFLLPLTRFFSVYPTRIDKKINLLTRPPKITVS